MDSIGQNPQRIIIKMPNWLGDLVMATPVLEDIKNFWPSTELTAMCQSSIAPLLKNNPHVDELFSYHRPNGWIPHQQHWDLISQIQHGKYDLGILLTNSFSSAWWFWRGKVKERVGYADNWRSLLLTKAVPYPTNLSTQHQVLTYKTLLESLGIPISDSDPTLYITEEEQAAAKKLLRLHGVEVGRNVIVGVNPGAAYGTAKCWLPDRFVEVTRRLLNDPNVYVVYFGDRAGVSLVNDICKEFPDRVVNLAGKTSLRELLALINLCTVLLTNDSGPMHIAAALKVPLLALFGSTSDVRTGPYKSGKVLHKHVECSPCYKRVCPIDFRCMKRIEVDEVYSELQKLLGNTAHKLALTTRDN